MQCHGVASPKMHSASEWPILLRRMNMRTRTLHDRLAGERVEGAVDEMLMAGLQSANIPTAEDQDSLLAYFTRHALPAAAPGETAPFIRRRPRAGPGRRPCRLEGRIACRHARARRYGLA